MPKENYSELIAMWSIQESLLQNYRIIFITSQSIILAVSGLIISVGNGWLALPLIILGFYVMRMWKGVCQARALDVTFMQWIILESDSGVEITTPLTTFKAWQKHKTFNNDNLMENENFINMTKSVTRIKMDQRLPNIYWFIYIIFSVACTYNIYNTCLTT